MWVGASVRLVLIRWAVFNLSNFFHYSFMREPKAIRGASNLQLLINEVIYTNTNIGIIITEKVNLTNK